MQNCFGIFFFFFDHEQVFFILLHKVHVFNFILLLDSSAIYSSALLKVGGADCISRADDLGCANELFPPCRIFLGTIKLVWSVQMAPIASCIYPYLHILAPFYYFLYIL